MSYQIRIAAAQLSKAAQSPPAPREHQLSPLLPAQAGPSVLPKSQGLQDSLGPLGLAQFVALRLRQPH